MKKSLFSMLLAVLALFSCSQCTTPDPDPEVNPDPEVTPTPENPEPEVPGAGEYTLVFPEVACTKTGWEAGDEIYFHGNYGPSAQVVTLQAGDIAEDGKTAKVNLSETLMELQCPPDGIYAVYPSAAVKHGDSLMDSVAEFTDWNTPILMSYLSGGSFVFRSVVSLLSFTVSGDFDSYALAANDRSGLRITGFKADYSSNIESINTFVTDGYPFREGAVVADGATPNRLYMPGGVTFKKGFTIFLGKDGQFGKVYTQPDAYKIKPGDVVDLGDITAALTDYTGPAPKMPEVTNMTKYKVSLNELSGLCVDLSGEFLWAVGDGSELGRISLEGEVLQKCYIYQSSSVLDSEGISMNYDNGDILISTEPNGIYRIPAAQIPNIFDESKFRGVERLFKIEDAKNFGNAGMEGCTYYKDGLLYSGSQTGSNLYCSNLETGEVLWMKPLRQMHPAITEIAGLSYDPLTDWLWVIDSESHKFFALTGDAEQILGAYTLKTRSNEESICIDHAHSCVWVGDDYGSTSYIYKYEFTGLDDAIITE